MATTVTGITLLQRVFIRGGLGIHLVPADYAIAAGTLTSTLWFANSNQGPNAYLNRIIYRPENATGVDDYVRHGTTVTDAGVLSIDRNWADTTETDEDIFVFEKGIHPSYVVDAMNTALRDLYFSSREPLSLAADAGFQSSATSSYTVGATGTFSKVTTAANVYPGMQRAGRFQCAATNDYIHQAFNVHPGKPFYAGALIRADVGTAKLVLYDVTNGAEIEASDAPEHTGEHWGYLSRTVTAPSGCESIQVRLQGEESSADFYLNGLWVYRPNESMVSLSSDWDTSHKAMALTKAAFRENIATGVDGGFSTQSVEIPRSDYGYEFSRPAANPNTVHLYKGTLELNQPIWIQGRRPHIDIDGPFTLALSETTSADLDLMDAATRVKLFQDERVKSILSTSDTRLFKALGEMEQYASQFAEEGAARKKPVINWTPGRGL